MPIIAASEVFEINLPEGAGRGVEGDEVSTLQQLVARQVEDALSWKEAEVEPEMTKATDFYMGRPYGDEREGRSQLVTTEVREAVAQTMPSLIRVFTSSERVVEFKPTGAEDVKVAEQQTDVVNYIFLNENNGFRLLHSVFKDALVRKLGIMKWGWVVEEKVKGSEHTELTRAELELLQGEDDITVEVLEEYAIDVPEPDPQDPNPDTGERFDIRLKRMEEKGRCKVEAVRPEEFVWTPDAKDQYDAVMVGHVRDVPASELISMGFDRKRVEKHLNSERLDGDNELARARRLDEGDDDHDTVSDGSMQKVHFAEVFIQYDSDDDGIAEIHKVHAIGNSYEILEDEIVDHIPFALFQIDPEPHTLLGLSQADFVMDLQHIISHVTRGMLDSLVAHLNPAMEVVATEVNMGDAENQELGRMIRVRRPGMMREIVTPFVGGSALPVLEQLHGQVSNRVGVNAATDGLNADALQSTTAAGVGAVVEAGKQRVEMMARMLAETGMRDLFSGILRTIVQHQDEEMVVRLRNEYVRVDPRHWNADKDVLVNVALGTGMVDEKINRLMAIAQKQEAHLQQGSPLVDYVTLRNNYARIVELSGFRNADSFFKKFGEQEQQEYAQRQSESQKPSDTEVLEKIEMAKIQAKAQSDQQKMQIEMARLQLDREKLQMEMAMKGKDFQLKAVSAEVDKAFNSARLQLDAQNQQAQHIKMAADTRIGE